MSTTSAPPPGRGLDGLIAVLLGLASVAIVVATNDMGFVRDEAFYFSDGEIYQDWFVRVEDPAQRTKALERKKILETWRNNSEHPPLDKILFGFSWRAFGRKLRPANRLREEKAHVVAEIGGLGPAHGFEPGAAVTLLVPQVVGKASSSANRTLARGQVLERTPYSATVGFPAGTDLAKLQSKCLGPGPGENGVIRRTGCEVVERRVLYVLSESEAMRLPGALFAGFLVACIYLAGRLWFLGRHTASGPGLLRRSFAACAALGYLCIPQPFWHAHLATFDTTITALLFVTSLAWLRSLRSRAWIWVTAVLWGISLLAKHNALFLPVPLVGMWLWDAWAEGRLRVILPQGRRKLLIAAGVGVVLAGALALVHPLIGVAALLLALSLPGLKIELPPVPAAFFVMLPVGFAILIAGWPLLWVDTLDNLLRWIEFHLHHEHYMQVWFGRVLAYPPFPSVYPWAMTLLTWPLTLLMAFVLGMLAVYTPRPVWRLLRRPEADIPWNPARRMDERGRTAEQRAWERLQLISVLWPMALISMPGTPIFGGTKHWMLAYPFMLLIGARGLQAVWSVLAAWLERSGPAALALTVPAGGTEAQILQQHLPIVPKPGWLRATLAPGLLTWALIAGVLGPAARATADAHPHGSAYWNELVGGVPGAADADLMRQFWGGSTRDGLDEVNRRAPQGALVYFHDAAWGAFQMYQREGWLRRDLRYTADAMDASQLGIIHHAKDLDDYELDMMRNYGSRLPVLQSSVEGVPIVSVYQRPSPNPSPNPSPSPNPNPNPSLSPRPNPHPRPNPGAR